MLGTVVCKDLIHIKDGQRSELHPNGANVISSRGFSPKAPKGEVSWEKSRYVAKEIRINHLGEKVRAVGDVAPNPAGD